MSIQLVQPEGISLAEIRDQSRQELQQQQKNYRWEYSCLAPVTELWLDYTLPAVPTVVQFFKIDEATGNLSPLYFVHYEFLRKFDCKRIHIQFVEPTSFYLILGVI